MIADIGRRSRIRGNHIVEFANLESRRYLAQARGTRGVQKIKPLLEAAKALVWEPAVRRWANLSVALSSSEIPSGDSYSTNQTILVPNGVEQRPAIQSASTSRVVLAVGSWWYEPNREGLEEVLQSVWPLVVAKIPEAKLLVVGRGADDLVSDKSPHSGVSNLGFVDDLQPLYESSALVLAPAKSGAGSQLKLVGALARGRVVVGPAYLERETRNGDLPADAVIGTDDQAETIVRLLENSEERHRREAAAIRFSRENSWEKVVAPIVAYLDTLARERSV
ncbi:glycosyltransferase involved in cell wall biosynthesis [Microbacterium laevaniformans]|uniref:glycosyltransferase family 4 protein n=1 Tax=Microbacterium laevaniformans TaxID=36807 RepID=UPI00195A79D5|nr:glycosyltransferase family 4 protein [Microbacterium laevaniformans]MBM7751590.1 glycosyltransferase involved in cell wall biosynthesis [Microbacterium laevaniformans]